MLKIAFDNIYKYHLEKGHRFPMEKYELIPDQLIREGTCTPNNFFSPEVIIDENALLTHEKSYYRRLSSLSLSKNEIRPIGFPVTKNLIKREKVIAQGTIDCSIYALNNMISMNIAGGTHHAFYDRGGAFCMLNDQAIAANFLLENNYVKKILILDLDVHQGDGTASIFSNNDNVFTLSFHGKNNYPFKKEKSDLDLALDDFTNDQFYLKKLNQILPKVIDQFQPEFIFYLSGVDVLESDQLGKLSLSIEACRERDNIVLRAAKENKIPIQISMGGGYSKKIRDIIEAHSNTFRFAQKIFF
tara:strand:- start:10 stop:912 length:903 start_codon:yes stop_codon:yes gene_type:complete